jgi:hypothetical protein
MTIQQKEDQHEEDDENLEGRQPTHPAERDIDLLLIEELHVDSKFISWFYEQVWKTEEHELSFRGAWHSLTHPEHGESDIVVLAGVDGRRLAILAENKIDAIAQPNQASRYRLRGDVGIEKAWWDQYRTCILAPQAYLDVNSEVKLYDSRISYESIKEWFGTEKGDCRSKYRAKIIEFAIAQNKRGYQPEPHGRVTQFWFDYWKLSMEEFPELQMKNPGVKPAGADWVRFNPIELQNASVILHKLEDGAVDLTILRVGADIERLKRLNKSLLVDGVSMLTTGESAAIRIVVPQLNRFDEFAPQLDKARSGLLAVSKLIELSHQIQI